MKKNISKKNGRTIKGTIVADNNQLLVAADNSIRTILDAAQEIIINSADNYWANTKNKYGHIKIEYNQKKGQIIFSDYGTGMSAEKLETSCTTSGGYTAVGEVRGMNSRGLKDCCRIGTVAIHTIQNNIYSTCKISDRRGFDGIVDQTATEEIRKKYGLKENGTVVIITRGEKQRQSYPFREYKRFVNDIRAAYCFRGITSEEASKKGSKLEVINSETQEREIIISKEPENSKIIKELKFPVPDYEKYEAKIIIKKSYEANDKKIIVMGSPISIHQENFLDPSINRSYHLENYFGYLECKGIDELAREYIKNPSNFDEDNPFNTVDADRREGLKTKHPFNKNLLKKPIEILKEIIKEEEAKEKESKDKEVTKEIKDINKEFVKFLSDYLDDDQDGDGDGDGEHVREFGYAIYPSNAKLLTNTKKDFTIHIHEDLIGNNIIITTNKKSLEDYLKIDSQIHLQKHQKFPDIYVGIFSIETYSDIAEGKIFMYSENENIGSLRVKILEIDEREFEEDFEFEHQNYNVNVDNTRSIKIFAKSPDLVKGRKVIEIKLDNDNIKLKSKSTTTLVPKKRTNYASAEIKIQGSHIDQSTTITALLGDKEAKTVIKIKKKIPKKGGFEIKLVKDNLGGSRYKWTDDHTELMVTYNHFQMNQYYDEKSDKQSENFFILFGQIMSDAFVERILKNKIEKTPEDFTYDDPTAAGATYAYYTNSIRRQICKGIHKIASNIKLEKQ